MMSAAEKTQWVEQPMTYEQFRIFCEENDGRWELVDGIPYAMAGASNKHNRVSIKLILRFGNEIERRKKCSLYASDMDLRLKPQEAKSERETVYRPDLMIVCDKSKIGKNSINGAPDLVVEILSPSTRKRDLNEKLSAYRKADVPEIWLVDPDAETVIVIDTAQAETIGRFYGGEEKIPVGALEGFAVLCNDIFENITQEEEEI